MSVSPDTQSTDFLPSALALLDRLPYLASREQVAEAVAFAMWQAHEAGYTAGRGDTLAKGNDYTARLMTHVVDQVANR